MDSFFNEPYPECCNPFPGMNLKFCWKVDSNYCSTCGRWLEAPYEHIKREERHTKNCTNEKCIPRPLTCLCGHTDKQHFRSVRFSDYYGENKTEVFMAAMNRLMNGPHNCSECACDNWKPNPDGPCD